MRVIKSIGIGLFFALVIILSTAFIISFVYEDEVSELFLREMNKRTEADIRAGEVNLSLLRKFPSATVEFRSFELYAGQSQGEVRDTALSFTAGHLFFQFDVVDIFRENYKLEKVEVDHARLAYSAADKDALPRFNRQGGKSINFDVEELVFNELHYQVNNAREDLHLEGHADEAEFSGNFDLERFTMEVDSRLFIEKFSVGDLDYIREKDVDLQVNLSVTPDQYRIEDGICRFERIPFVTEGVYHRKEQTLRLNLRGTNLDIDELQVYIPWNLKQKLKPVVVHQGQLDFYAKIQGPVNEGRPNVQADFSLNNGQVTLHRDDIELDHISLSGYLSNGRYKNAETSEVSFNNIYAEMKRNTLEGNLKITDFKDPQIISEGHLKLYPRDMDVLFPDRPVWQKMRGWVNVRYKYSDALSALSNIDESIQYGNLTLDANLNGVAIQDGGYQLQELNGFLYLNRDLHLDSVELVLNNNAMVVDGTIYGIHRNLSDSTSPYRFGGDLYSRRLNLRSLFHHPENAGDSLINFQFPRKMKGTLDFAIGQLAMKRFQAQKVQGRLQIGPDHLKLNDVELNAFSGKAFFQADLKSQPAPQPPLLLDAKFFLERVNIHRIFQSFNNFGQDYITAQNIQGELSGEMTFNSQMNHHLQVHKESVSSFSDIVVDNGELIDFEPLMSISNFVNVDELRHVTFSQLSNQITIKDQFVRIPEMQINSSSYDIQVSGYHRFNNRFSYDVSLLLSQILSKKARQTDRYSSEFGNIQEDGVGQSRLFLKVHGTPEQYAIEYNKEGLRQKIRSDLQREKEELKHILHQEFGWFEKDTATGNPPGSPQQKFNIQWEESTVSEDALNPEGTDPSGQAGSRGPRPKEEKESEATPANKKGEATGKQDSGFIIKFEEDTLR